MDKLKDNDNRKYVCDDCVNNCKKKATGCSEWKKNTLENKYERILYMGECGVANDLYCSKCGQKLSN